MQSATLADPGLNPAFIIFICSFINNYFEIVSDTLLEIVSSFFQTQGESKTRCLTEALWSLEVGCYGWVSCSLCQFLYRYFPKQKKFQFWDLLLNVGSSGKRKTVNVSVPLHWEQTAGKCLCVFRSCSPPGIYLYRLYWFITASRLRTSISKHAWIVSFYNTLCKVKLALLKICIQFTIYINKNLEIKSVLINLNFIPKFEQTRESHPSLALL